MKENFITEEKKKKLEEELDFLVKVERKKIIEQLKISQDFKDLKENEEYQTAKNNQAALESKITKLEIEIKTSKVVDGNAVKEKVIGGSVVEVMFSNDKKKIYSIGEEGEGRSITPSSPLALALLGKKVGDVVSAVAPKGKLEMKILNIY